MQVESAGSKIQTTAARLIFTGHSYHNDSCIWYSDDHGRSCQTIQPSGLWGTKLAWLKWHPDGS